MNYSCPICKKSLTVKMNTTDYICRDDRNHVYIQRVEDNKITIIKIRLIEVDGSKMFCKIRYDKNISEVWIANNDNISNQRVQINHALDTDLADLDKLKQKLRTYILFS